MNKSSFNSESKLKSCLAIGDTGVSDNLLAILKSNCGNYLSSVKKFIELLKYIQNNNIHTKSFNELVALHELVAPHDCAVVSMLSIHFNLAIGTITNLGVQTPYVEDLYQKLCSGRAIGVYLATELAHGNDLIAIETQANYLPEKGVFMLNSPGPNAYKFMPNTMPCELPKVAVILAQLNVSGKKYGIFPFILPLSANGKLTPGVKIALYLKELTRKVSSILSESVKNFKFSDELLIEIITSKSLCTWRTQEILINCRERCGAQGLFSVNKISPYLISNFGTITSEGDNLVLSLKAGGMIILNKMKEIDKTFFQHNLFPILNNYMNILYKKLNGLIVSNNKKINLDMLNKHSRDFLELSQTYAVLSVVTTTIDTYHDNNNDDLGMIIEGYLLDWIHRSMSNLLRSEVINLQESKKIDERRIEYIRQHADRINNYISSFGVDKIGIETPISSNDYISWYADNHHQLKNN
ncbi:cytochrome-c oxidase [Photorhabdus bodei]|uniref:acyl-CoA dehydrogenase family protein n=1 Tax=Photorhabdus bodei TaxID=2029681 RepID=UPI001E2FF65E|nr:cytochrome-c oxidase [Photorhabdus bodei]MCC8374954.1 cytochrome-c oxidase [Photorhabdus bodei]